MEGSSLQVCSGAKTIEGGTIMKTSGGAIKIKQNRVKDYENAFSLFDLNKDGKVTVEDLFAVLKCLGQAPTEEEVKYMIKEIDADGSGTVQLGEFIALTDNDDMKEIEQAFEWMDINDRGFITASELRQVMTNLGEKLTDDEVDEMIQEADKDNDGHVNFEDFLEMMLES